MTRDHGTADNRRCNHSPDVRCDPLYVTPHELDPASGETAFNHPGERGEAFVAVMRDLAYANVDVELHEELLEELVRIMRPFDDMNAVDLGQVLEGLHEALQTFLVDLIVRQVTEAPLPCRSVASRNKKFPRDEQR